MTSFTKNNFITSFYLCSDNDIINSDDLSPRGYCDVTVSLCPCFRTPFLLLPGSTLCIHIHFPRHFIRLLNLSRFVSHRLISYHKLIWSLPCYTFWCLKRSKFTRKLLIKRVLAGTVKRAATDWLIALFPKKTWTWCYSLRKKQNYQMCLTLRLEKDREKVLTLLFTLIYFSSQLKSQSLDQVSSYDTPKLMYDKSYYFLLRCCSQ